MMPMLTDAEVDQSFFPERLPLPPSVVPTPIPAFPYSGAAARAVVGHIPATPTPPVTSAGVAAYPRINPEGGGFIVAIEAVSDEAKALWRTTCGEGLAACTDQLHAVRDDFFEQGAGREYRRQQVRLADAEVAVAKAKLGLADLQSRWTSAIATDGTKDIDSIEEILKQQERQVDRLAARMPIIQGELSKAKSVAQDALATLITKTTDDFKLKAEARVREAQIELASSLTAAFVQWLKAGNELDGAMLDNRTLTQLRSLD